MMNVREVFDRFEKIGPCSFATVGENGEPISRVAHFFAADEDGLYLRTMNVKPFYFQMKNSGWLSVCGDVTPSNVESDESGLPTFEPSYAMRVTGKVRELSLDEVMAKAEHNEAFRVAVHDIKKYPRTVVFVMYRGNGELYDYDFGMQARDHKLLRERFAFGGDTFVEPGLTIGEECIGCGACFETCTFKAIVPGENGEPYSIRGERCDECGNCYNVCPAGAVHLHDIK